MIDDPSGGRRIDAGDRVDERRLARAIRADQPENLARVERERRIPQRGDATEDFAHMLRRKHNLRHIYLPDRQTD